MIDVPEPAQVPLGRATAGQRPGGDARSRRAHDTNLDPRGCEAVVERLRAPFRVGALPVDDEPDGDVLRGLGDQRVRKPVPDDTRPEAELVDVDGGRGGGDVGEHSRVERGALDEDLHRRGRALVEPEHERPAARRAGEQPFGLPADAVVRDDESRTRPHPRRLVQLLQGVRRQPSSRRLCDVTVIPHSLRRSLPTSPTAAATRAHGVGSILRDAPDCLNPQASKAAPRTTGRGTSGSARG